MKKAIPILFTLACLLVLAEACKHEIPEKIIPTPPTGSGGGPGGTAATLVCFESEVLPIFLSSCAISNCHDAASHEGDYVFNSYDNIMRQGIRPGNATNSKVYKVLFESGDDRMPRQPNPELTAAQKAIIGRWINEGARNTTNCSSGCDTTQFKYSANISTIISNNCVGCHGGTAPSGGVFLGNFDGVRLMAMNGRLYGAITHTPGYIPMPQNAPKLNECQITQVRKWIENGALNN